MPFDGLIFIYQTDPVGYASKRVFLSSLTLSYTNFIMLRIYAEALDRLRVCLNMYLVFNNFPSITGVLRCLICTKTVFLAGTLPRTPLGQLTAYDAPQSK